jgi:hypothetical protein
MSLVPTREYTDPAQMLADYAARKRRLSALRYEPPAPPPPPEPPPPPSLNEILSCYRLVIDTLDPVIDFAAARFAASMKPRRSAWSITIAIIKRETGVRRFEIEGQCRTHGIVQARMMACWLMRLAAKRTFPQIGRLIGGRDHTTVMHSVRRIEAMIEEDAAFREQMHRLRAEMLEALPPPISDVPPLSMEAA